MSKTIPYIAAAIVFLGIGALVAGLSIWYHHPNLMKEAFIEESRYAQCNLISTGVGGDVQGTLFMEQFRPSSSVRISGNITDLSEGLHGFHVHELGSTGNGCKDAGGHYNPFNANHSAPNSTERHVGDLGNVEARRDDTRPGNTITNVLITDNILTMFGHFSIVGRAIVVHEAADDLGLGGNSSSLTTGNAGRRVACCTIYITKPPTQ